MEKNDHMFLTGLNSGDDIWTAQCPYGEVFVRQNFPQRKHLRRKARSRSDERGVEVSVFAAFRHETFYLREVSPMTLSVPPSMGEVEVNHISKLNAQLQPYA